MSMYCASRQISQESQNHITAFENKFKTLIKYPEIIPELDRLKKVQTFLIKKLTKSQNKESIKHALIDGFIP